jgi:FKBP-type peptidyl-prolyl cis-trans isomerase
MRRLGLRPALRLLALPAAVLGAPVARPAALRAQAVAVTDLTVGTGASAAAGKCLYVHYTGWLADGTLVETSRDPLPDGRPRPPVAFQLGARQVLPGWERGLRGMKAGGVRRLAIPWKEGYGERGNPPLVPPRADLVFELELVDVRPTRLGADGALGGRGAACPEWTPPP